MHSTIKYAEISDEIKLPYIEQGDVSGIPVILLHGATDSLRSFDLLLPHLPKSIRAFALTQRGHGDASRPESYSPDDFADDAAKFMDINGIESAVIVGHSMGGFIAQRLAIKYPKRVSGLVLIGTFAACKNNEVVVGFFEEAVSTLNDPIPFEFVREFQAGTIAQPVPEDFFGIVVRESLKVPARVWKAIFGGLISNDNTSELSKIEAPTLIIWGEQDAMFSKSEQEKLLENIPNSRLVIYPNVGHCPNWEKPEKTAGDLMVFIKELINLKRGFSHA